VTEFDEWSTAVTVFSVVNTLVAERSAVEYMVSSDRYSEKVKVLISRDGRVVLVALLLSINWSAFVL